MSIKWPVHYQPRDMSLGWHAALKLQHATISVSTVGVELAVAS